MNKTVILAFLLAALCGCRSEAPEPPEQAQGPAAGQSSARAHLAQDRIATPAAGRDETFHVMLVPENLTGSEDVSARLFGCLDRASYTWTVNGREIADAGLPRLDSRYYARDDVVAVTANCNGQQREASVMVLNSPPVISGVSFSDPEVTSGKDLTVVPQASDSDGDPIDFSYRWFIDGEEQFDLYGATLPGDRIATGSDIALTVIPSDGMSEGEPFSGAPFIVPNAPPRFASQPPQDFRSEVYSYAVQGYDPDGDPLAYRLEEAPAGMTIDSETGLLSWPLDGVAAGEYRVAIVIADPQQMEARQEYTLNLSLQETN